jgi:hypothetical protein
MVRFSHRGGSLAAGFSAGAEGLGAVEESVSCVQWQVGDSDLYHSFKTDVDKRGRH